MKVLLIEIDLELTGDELNKINIFHFIERKVIRVVLSIYCVICCNVVIYMINIRNIHYSVYLFRLIYFIIYYLRKYKLFLFSTPLGF